VTLQGLIGFFCWHIMTRSSVFPINSVKANAPPRLPQRRLGRPRLSEVAVLDALVISTAKGLFYERGFMETSMAAVAQAARISKGTLYSRFSDKPALFIALFEDQIRLWWEAVNIPEAPAPDQNLAVWLRYRGSKILETALSPEFIALRQVLDPVRVQFPELAQKFYETGPEMGVLEIAGKLEAAGERAGIPCRDAHGAAAAFLSMLLGWANEKMVRGQAGKVTKEEQSEWADRAAALFTEGRAAW
jgi:TetR/AcrR family transcriptional repressor of mexJK operon